MNFTLLSTLAASAICFFCTGCTLCQNLVRTSVVQPIQYSGYWDRMHDRHKFRKIAVMELERARSVARAESDNYACNPFSVDHESGFVAGFIDYLMYGGTHPPPPLPPRRYWWSDCDVRACSAIESWYQGFQHGVAVAQASGYRDCVTIPLAESVFLNTVPVYGSPGVDGSEEIELPAGQPDESVSRLPESEETAEGLGELISEISELGGLDPSSAPVLTSPPALYQDQPDSEDEYGLPGPVRFPSSPSDLVDREALLVPPSTRTPSKSVAAIFAGFRANGDLIELQSYRSESAANQPLRHDASAYGSGAKTDSSVQPQAAPKTDRNVGESVESEPRLHRSGVFANVMFLMALASLWFGRRHESTHDTDSRIGRAIESRRRRRLSVERGLAEPRCRRPATCRSLAAAVLICACCFSTGCASLTNPVLNGIPVRKLPPELLSQPRRDLIQTVPLSLLRQKQPEDYLLAAGDVLGVYIAGVFPPTTADQPLTTPPVYFPSQIDPAGAGLPPSLGYPVTIRNDGTLSLPLVEPISLEGLTVEQANERVRDAYVDTGILQPGRESVMLTLMQPRQIRVLVFRQEVGGFTAGGLSISSNNLKRGTGHIIHLRAYENDVVNALANTGGLPGLDAYSGVYVFRGALANLNLPEEMESLPPEAEIEQLSQLAVRTDFIPTRWPPGEPLPFQPEDVILQEGDVVLLEARARDLYYTAGLLPAAQRILPRDYDLDVVEAVIQANGTLINGAFAGSNFNGLLIQKGIGNPNPSALTVIRRTCHGGQIPIRVDLNRALVDPRERILIHPDDVLILQETTHEAFARYLNNIFNFNIFVEVFRRNSAVGTAALTQLPSI